MMVLDDKWSQVSRIPLCEDDPAVLRPLEVAARRRLSALKSCLMPCFSGR